VIVGTSAHGMPLYPARPGGHFAHLRESAALSELLQLARWQRSVAADARDHADGSDGAVQQISDFGKQVDVTLDSLKKTPAEGSYRRANQRSAGAGQRENRPVHEQFVSKRSRS
jgi:hypothetical protein